MKFDVLTLFPELFANFCQESLIKKAIDQGLISIKTHNIRDYTTDKHHKVDDTPFGGGSGMLLMAEPIFTAHAALTEQKADEKVKTKTIYLSPSGKRLDHSMVLDLAEEDQLILLAGRYEGVDQRVIDQLVDQEVSIGDYVLFGGELPAMVLIEAVSRQVDGVLGNQESLRSESFSQGLLEYPQYTKPRSFQGLEVPEVLTSGNHRAIQEWKDKKAREKTRQLRPDLLCKEEEQEKEKEEEK